jgi:hypothetical protein
LQDSSSTTHIFSLEGAGMSLCATL